MANNIFNNFDIAYNSIADQKLTAANTLTIKVWNEIITTLKTQANVNAKYLTALNKWLIGEDQVSIPGENSFVEYVTNFINNVPSIGYYASYNVNNDYELPTTKAVNKIVQDKTSALNDDITNRLKTKADLVGGTVPLEQLDHTEVEEISIGKSTNYNLNSDGQVLTSKVVNSVVNKKFNEAKELIDNNTNKINTNKINIESNKKNIQANATYAQALSQRITDTESTLKKKADLVEGKVPASQLPGYVDDVIEVNNYDDLPTTGESGKIYIDKSTNITYRWSGTQYTVIGKDLALGETASTAFPGDRGKELELTSVKKTKENVQNTSLREIRKNYGDVVAAQYADNKYVLLVFGTIVNQNNECSLTIYDNGTARYAKNVWLDWTLGQALSAAVDFDSEYTYTDAKIDSLISASPMSTYDLDLTEASWVRIAKVKDLQKNSSGLFIFDCYGKKVDDEGTVLDSVLHTTLKPEHKYEFGMDYTLRELYNYTNENRPFEIIFYTSHENRLTALYWSPDSYIVNNKTIAPSGPDQQGAYEFLKHVIADMSPKLTGIYMFDLKHNEEDGTEFFALNPTYKGGLTQSYYNLHSASVKKEACRLYFYGYAYVHSEMGTQQLKVVPPYTLYCNGVELFRNTTYIRDIGNATLDDIKECSILVDHINAEDVYTIEYNQYPEADIEIRDYGLATVYDMDNTILTVKGYIEGTNEYIESESTSRPIPCPMEYSTHQEILTTSTFNVTCGLDDNGSLITDVLPITQSPELSGTDSSGGGSGGGDIGSGGSGLTGTHGLTSILLENYEGETYVCGLINYPNTGNYLGTYIEMKIENNLNFETLNRLEVVDIEEKTNNGEFQLLEGTKFESDLRYDFTIRTTVQNLINSINTIGRFDFNLYDSNNSEYTICFVQSGSPMIIGGVTSNRYIEGVASSIIPIHENFIDNNIRLELYETYDYFNGEEKSLYDLLYSAGATAMSDTVVDESHTLSANLPSLSGTLYIHPNDPWSEETYVKVTYNGIVTEYNFERNKYNEYNDLAIPLENITSDNSYITIESNNARTDKMQFIPSDAVVEYTITGFNPPKDFEFKNYSVNVNTLDASVFGNNYYKFHKTSDSYDLFSVYNFLSNMQGLPSIIDMLSRNISNDINPRISEIEQNISNILNSGGSLDSYHASGYYYIYDYDDVIKWLNNDVIYHIVNHYYNPADNTFNTSPYKCIFSYKLQYAETLCTYFCSCTHVSEILNDSYSEYTEGYISIVLKPLSTLGNNGWYYSNCSIKITLPIKLSDMNIIYDTYPTLNKSLVKILSPDNQYVVEIDGYKYDKLTVGVLLETLTEYGYTLNYFTEGLERVDGPYIVKDKKASHLNVMYSNLWIQKYSGDTQYVYHIRAQSYNDNWYYYSKCIESDSLYLEPKLKITANGVEGITGGSNIDAYTKTEVDNKLTRSNLISTIGNATETLAGVMSANDKKNLNTLVALLQDDKNDVVDTIKEVLAIFEQYPEGANLVSALSGKADKSDTYSKAETDNLLADKANKADTYTKTEVDEKVAAGGGLTASVSNGTLKLSSKNL